MRNCIQRFAPAFLALPLSLGMAQSPVQAKPVRPSGSSIVQAARQNPSSLPLVTAAGEYYLSRQQWRSGAKWLSRAYQLSGQDPKIGYDLAYARIQAGDLDAARQQLDQMSSQHDAARIHTLLAEVEQSRGNANGAVQQYYRAAQMDPSESNIFDLANCLLQNKKYVGYLPESVKYFRYGVSKFPRSSKLMVGLGVALYASQEYDEAVKVLCEAVDLDPADPRPVTFLGMARKVSPDLARQVDQRLQAFAARYPHSSAANYEYAMSLWDRGGGEEGKNLAEIQTLLERAVQAAPSWFEPHYQLGRVYEEQKQYRAAIREMRTTTQLQPDFKPAHFQLAILYRRTGDNARAAQESARTKDLDNAQRNREMLQQAPR